MFSLSFLLIWDIGENRNMDFWLTPLSELLPRQQGDNSIWYFQSFQFKNICMTQAGQRPEVSSDKIKTKNVQGKK